jgi:hypothetical protein
MTFAALIQFLRGRHAVLRVRPHAVLFAVDGELVEVFRVSVAGVEWAALTCPGGLGELPNNPGLGAVVRCPDGWGLRLSLPIGEVAPATFADVVLRLAGEARAVRGTAPAVRVRSFFEMWSDEL